MVFKRFYCTIRIPMFILTQCGIYIFTILFIQAIFTLIISLYKTISIKYYFQQNITFFDSIAHGFFNIPKWSKTLLTIAITNSN